MVSAFVSNQSHTFVVSLQGWLHCVTLATIPCRLGPRSLALRGATQSEQNLERLVTRGTLSKSSSLWDMRPPDEVYGEGWFWNMKNVSFSPKLITGLDEFTGRVIKLADYQSIELHSEHLRNWKNHEMQMNDVYHLNQCEKVYLTLASIWWAMETRKDVMPNSSFFPEKPTTAQRRQVMSRDWVGWHLS